MKMQIFVNYSMYNEKYKLLLIYIFELQNNVLLKKGKYPNSWNGELAEMYTISDIRQTEVTLSLN